MVKALSTHDAAQRKYLNNVVIAGTVGATVEWYDFFLYGTAAALVFNQLFFPSFDPTIGTLAAFASFGVGYISRPLGGLIFGHYGDRVGRKQMLILTMLIMGLGTFCIGLLPSYSAIGIWAPVLLFVLRFVQGIGLGGEWGGAVLIAVENAPSRKRGYFGSLVQIGAPAGLLLGTLAFAGVSQLPRQQLLTWGWRIPFLISIVLVGVGYLVRVKLLETPEFAAVKAAKAEVRVPIVTALRTFPRSVFVTMGARLSEGQVFNIFAVVIILYATTELHVSKTLVLAGVLIGAGLECVTLPMFGALSDHIGRRPVFIFGAAFCGVYAFPFFLLLDTKAAPAVLLAPILGFAIGHSAMWASEAAFFSEVFSTDVRYSGASFVYQFAGLASSGIVPLVSAALITAAGGSAWAVALFVIGYSVVSVVSTILAPETFRVSLSHVGVREVDATPRGCATVSTDEHRHGSSSATTVGNER